MSVQWSGSRLCEYLNVDRRRSRHLLVYVYGGAQSNKPYRTEPNQTAGENVCFEESRPSAWSK